jgi:hypothetical protein
MRKALSGLVACGLAATIVMGCSGGSKGATDAATDAEAGVGANANTCQGIRGCVFLCKSDIEQPCAQNCIAQGSPLAQATYQALAACTARYCPTGDFYCGCEQHCFVDGNCLVETEACVAGSADLVCEMLCH